MSFETATLESLCELVVDCPHSTPKWTDEGIIVLRNQNIKNGVLDLSSPSFTNEDDYQKRIKRAVPRAGDIVFTREAPMGEVCMVPEGLKCCLGQRQVLLRPKSDVNGQYLFWALQSPYVQQQIAWNEGTGSTVSNVRIPVLKALNIPRIANEDMIAKSLTDIASKLSLNTQTNQTLEQMAQAIFKSWFVDFDPVKAKMNGEQPEGMDAATASLFPEKLVESELGLTPEGWPVGKLSELIKFANGKSGKKSDSGRFPLYGANGIIGFSEEAKFEDAVIIGRVGAYCGAIEYCNSQFWASDNTIVATAKSGKAQLPFVLYLLKHLDLNQHAGGAAQPLLNQKVLNSLEIPIPTDAVLEKYSELLSTMLEKMAHNIEENHNLERLRDTLLPKLLSGEIELGNAEESRDD